MRIKFAIAAILLLQALPALAYIGPGSGISLLGGLWGVFVAIVLAVGAVLIWPIRYVFRRLKRKFGGGDPNQAAKTADAAEGADSEPPTGRSE